MVRGRAGSRRGRLNAVAVVETGSMALQDLVVRPGDRVSVAGRYVARDDGDWLDMALVNDLLFHPREWVSRYSLRLLSLDPGGVASDGGLHEDIAPGRVRVTGVWDGDAVTVETQAVA